MDVCQGGGEDLFGFFCRGGVGGGGCGVGMPVQSKASACRQPRTGQKLSANNWQYLATTPKFLERKGDVHSIPEGPLLLPFRRKDISCSPSFLKEGVGGRFPGAAERFASHNGLHFTKFELYGDRDQ